MGISKTGKLFPPRSELARSRAADTKKPKKKPTKKRGKNKGNFERERIEAGIHTK